jgi:hypothetical protein
MGELYGAELFMGLETEVSYKNLRSARMRNASKPTTENIKFNVRSDLLNKLDEESERESAEAGKLISRGNIITKALLKYYGMEQ